MRERLVAAFVGLTLLVVALYGVPRAYFLADLVRSDEQARVGRTADALAVALDLRDRTGEPLTASYLDDLERELDLVAEALGTRRTVTQLHWGGGTPNHLDDAQLARLAAAIAQRFTLAPDAEASVEADPRLATPAQLALLRSLGFRRISFGVQDLDPDVQAAIGRRQPPALIEQVLRASRDAGFDGVNVDLVYGLPRQTAGSFAQPPIMNQFGYSTISSSRMR